MDSFGSTVGTFKVFTCFPQFQGSPSSSIQTKSTCESGPPCYTHGKNQMSCTTFFLSALRTVTNRGPGPPLCCESCTKSGSVFNHYHALTLAGLGARFIIFLTPDRLSLFFCAGTSLTKLRAPSSSGMMPKKQNFGYHGPPCVRAWRKATSGRMPRHVRPLRGLIWNEGSGFT